MSTPRTTKKTAAKTPKKTAQSAAKTPKKTAQAIPGAPKLTANHILQWAAKRPSGIFSTEAVEEAFGISKGRAAAFIAILRIKDRAAPHRLEPSTWVVV